MRRSLSCVAVLGLALLFAVPAARAQTVDEIVAKNLQAKGGVEKLKETNSVRMTGRATMQGMEVPIVTSVKRPHFMRNEMEIAGQKMVQMFDGEAMWMTVAGMPPQPVPDAGQIESAKQTSAFDPVFLDWNSKGHKITLVGKETDGGKPVHHLLVTTKGGVFHYYIDVETGLESKFTTTTDMQGMKGEIETRMSDYRTVDGRTLPFKITTFMNGNQLVEMKYEKIEFNIPLEDALFKAK